MILNMQLNGLFIVSWFFSNISKMKYNITSKIQLKIYVSQNRRKGFLVVNKLQKNSNKQCTHNYTKYPCVNIEIVFYIINLNLFFKLQNTNFNWPLEWFENWNSPFKKETPIFFIKCLFLVVLMFTLTYSMNCIKISQCLVTVTAIDE